ILPSGVAGAPSSGARAPGNRPCASTPDAGGGGAVKTMVRPRLHLEGGSRSEARQSSGGDGGGQPISRYVRPRFRLARQRSKRRQTPPIRRSCGRNRVL